MQEHLVGLAGDLRAVSKRTAVALDYRIITSRNGPCECRARPNFGCILDGVQGEWGEQGRGIFLWYTGLHEYSTRFAQEHCGEVARHHSGCMVERPVTRHSERSEAELLCKTRSGLDGLRIAGDRSGDLGAGGQGELGSGEGHQRMQGASGPVAAEGVDPGSTGGVEYHTAVGHPGGGLLDGAIWDGEPGEGSGWDRVCTAHQDKAGVCVRQQVGG